MIYVEFVRNNKFLLIKITILGELSELITVI